MVKLPDTILRSVVTGSDKTASVEELVSKFLMNGYGENKAKKWIRTYCEIGLLQRCEDDPSRVTCLWW